MENTLFDNLEFIQKYNSKRNEVYKVKNKKSGNIFVLKNFKDKNSFFTEINLISKLKSRGISVPDIIDTKHNCILLEYIKGPTLLDLFLIIENKGVYMTNDITIDSKVFINKLCKWFYDFYNIFDNERLIYHDINLRNFIFSKDKIYGVDFESVKQGDKEEDFGRLLAFILTYSPEFTNYKINFCKDLLTNIKSLFSCNIDKIIFKAEKELQFIEKRRKTSFNTNQKKLSYLHGKNKNL